MMKNETQTPFSQWAVAILFAALSIIALYVFVTYAEPPERKPGTKFVRNYSEEPLTAALTEPNLKQVLSQIKTASLPTGTRQLGRVTGSIGCENTEKLIMDTFTKAGLDVKTQTFPVAVPITEYCELLDDTGKPLPGVTLYPFEPSGMLPTALPKEGIDGPLLITESGSPLDLVGKPLEGSIVLNHGLDIDWPALASMGAKAVIVCDDPLDTPGDPDGARYWSSQTTPYDVQFPRFYVRGSIDQYAGKSLRIRCKVTWQTKYAQNVIGVLKADHPNSEALIINSYYDSYSMVPELAPGGEQAVSLAVMLQMANAFAPYKANLIRDVIFVATAGHGQGWSGTYSLLEAIETFSKDFRDYKSLETLQQTAKTTLRYVNDGLAIIDSPEPWIKADMASPTIMPSAVNAYRTQWMKHDPAFRKWFEKAFATVAGEINLERREEYMQARLAWIRAGRPAFRPGFDLIKASASEKADPANQDPTMKAYITAKAIDTRAGNIISTPFWTIAFHLSPKKPGETDDFTAWGYRERFKAYMMQLKDYHTRQISMYDERIALHKLFEKYRATMTINLELYSGGAKQWKNLSVLAGLWNPGTVVEPQSTDLRNAISDCVPPLPTGDPAYQVTSWGTADASGSPNDQNIHSGLDSQIWFKFGRVAFTVASKSFFPPKVGTPDDTFESLTTAALAEQLPVLGRALLAVAHGNVTFKSIKPLANARDFISCSGRVFTSAGTSSIVPTHWVGQNTFVRIYTNDNPPYDARGVRPYPLLQVDPYGQYQQKFLVIAGWSSVGVDGVRFDNDGRLLAYKDISTVSQGIFQNEKVPDATLAVGGGGTKEMNLSLFRCTEVACYQRVNPKTLNNFPRFDFLSSLGMGAPDSVHLESKGPGICAFLPPDTSFYVAMMDGSAANPNIQTYRAFMLNVADLPPFPWDPVKYPLDPVKDKTLITEPELFGKGYIAADMSNMTFPYFDGAASMLRTNAKRLRLQLRYHMADEQMIKSQQDGEDMLAHAWELRKQGDAFSAVNEAGKSFSFVINNHPVIRNKIANAVFGILWYLGILVPFVFFLEKLLFGFTDVRRQLLAIGVIFVGVFLLLRFFHPAFQMVSNPMIILLGFLIFLLAIVVTIMVSGKFQQVIRTLRRKEGYVEGADVNRGGVIGTAFMLGLNNMRRRKVRTGLTCVTLILITFVMICFTSVNTNINNVEFMTGRSPSNGIMRRDPNFLPVSDNEINNIRQIYGLQYPISINYWLVGGADPLKKLNTDILLDREYVIGGQKITKRGKVNAAVTMQHNEPMFTGIDKYLITRKGRPLQERWFPAGPDTAAAMTAAIAAGYKPQNYVILPDKVASELDITPESVDAGTQKLLIRGEEYVVQGIFNSTELDKHLGMDGQSILPYDLNSQLNAGKMNTDGSSRNPEKQASPQNIERLKAYQVILTSKAPVVQPKEQNIAVSCSILFPSQPFKLRSDLPEFAPVTYRQQDTTIAEYLERLGIGAYFAKGNIAYYGYRTRAKTSTGLIELLIPILIAAMTVFNTMRGSVYERKDEIYVYNAVGIAPNHIFFMFMAEACVYAVIGAMAGYLLSQISGTILVKFGLSGGLNMDYSSIETIYASLAIVASVMLSTIIPAHTASRLALPSDEVSWSVPKAEGDVLQFNLPFTFTAHDRLAVISYFSRWLDANGEGSAGSFFCGPPSVRMDYSTDEDGNGGLIPGIEATVWLKPFDLGVSQQLLITLPTDPETGEYIARISIERLNGTIAAWNRAVMPFLGALRKQFLNWRAVGDEERADMFIEAKALFTKTTVEDRETVNV